MAMALVSSILQMTTSLAATFRGSPSSSSSRNTHADVEEELRRLERTAKRIQAFLHDAEEREVREESVKLWLTGLKRVAYDAEDVLDEYQYELLRQQVEARNAAQAVNSLKRKRVDDEDDDDDDKEVRPSTYQPKPFDAIETLGRIKKIREEFDEIARDRDALNLRDLGPRRRDDSFKPLPTSSLVVESDVFGRDDDREKLIHLLFSDMACKFSVIPIVGMGGLGKTTLAQLVYNDQSVQERFEVRGWVCVSDDFDVMRLTKEIITSSFSHQRCSLVGLDALQQSLREQVQGKRVLLVLDDVWNESQSPWHSLRAPFASADFVRIIITTRNESAAKVMRTTTPIYRPGRLSEDESWSLFSRHAFEGRDLHEEASLADIGKQIVKKCDGLPLALKVLGGLLRHETEEEEWRDVLLNDIWELKGGEEVLPILKLSYDRMPIYLRPCFLFCAAYPKDNVFRKSELVMIWMALGYVQARGGRQMEDIAEGYFDELRQRSYFQSVYVEGNEFVMHDMIHELALSLTGGQCCSINFTNDNDVKAWESISNNIKHIYVNTSKQYEKQEKFVLLWESEALRTLSWTGIEFESYFRDQFQFNNLGGLRVLELHAYELYELPSSINNLKHLRYLSIQCDFLNCLSDSICLLYNLWALDLRWVRNVSQIPSRIGNLINLRYFRLVSENLHELPGSIGHLCNLQTLSLKHCRFLKQLPESIGHLCNLQTLSLKHCRFLKQLPESIGQLSNLQTLNLSYCHSLEQLPESIGRLSNLQTLNLNYCSSLEQLPESIGQLSNLQTLNFNYCWLLKQIPETTTKLVNLRHLYIEEQVSLPQGIGKLTNLQTLKSFRVGRDERHSGIKELKSLTNLRGKELSITGLQNVDKAEDAKAVNLKSRHHLEDLILMWGPDVKEKGPWGDDEELKVAVLEHLKPHTNLRFLRIDGYSGARFASWMGNPSFSKLTKVYLIGCTNVQLFPPLGQLPSLTNLYIERMNKMQGFEHGPLYGEEGTVTSTRLFPSLQDLHLVGMPEWEEWEPATIEAFPLLTRLVLYDCPKLKSIPTIPSIRELEIHMCPQLKLKEDQYLHPDLQPWNTHIYGFHKSKYGVDSEEMEETLARRANFAMIIPSNSDFLSSSIEPCTIELIAKQKKEFEFSQSEAGPSDLDLTLSLRCRQQSFDEI